MTTSPHSRSRHGRLRHRSALQNHDADRSSPRALEPLAFLPDDKILLTERVRQAASASSEKNGALSGARRWRAQTAASPDARDIGVLDVVLSIEFTTNHRIFFSFYDFGTRFSARTSNTYIARATLDEAKVALPDAKAIFEAPPAIPSKKQSAARPEAASPSQTTAHLFMPGGRSVPIRRPGWSHSNSITISARITPHYGRRGARA